MKPQLPKTVYRSSGKLKLKIKINNNSKQIVTIDTYFLETLETLYENNYDMFF